ncbi:curli assembly protein CsgF [Pseudogemmobacter sp. W21_MBD1_M6]|uniref:curli assembly protein CsgF n=1 Tax=Pseudogemmobacter sp. W21_MBD1_M6 TaxID=3240271 RepID=UPI003F9834C2
MNKVIIFLVMATFAELFGHPAAAEMSYSPVLPQFGGTNGQALTVLQFDLQLQSAADAKKEADALALENAMAPPKAVTTSTDRLISSLEAALQVRLAHSYADQIFNTVDTDVPVSIQIGDTTITYSRIDGYLTIDIIDDSGAATQFGIDLAER